MIKVGLLAASISLLASISLPFVFVNMLDITGGARVSSAAYAAQGNGEKLVLYAEDSSSGIIGCTDVVIIKVNRDNQ